MLKFESTEHDDLSYQIALNPADGTLRFSSAKNTIMTFNKEGTQIDCSDNVVLKTHGLEIQNQWSFSDSQLKYNGVPQWKLVHDEVFRVGEPAEGWSIPDATTKCGAIHMLGGYCKTSTENLIKVFDKLPAHQRIRIQANFHFIDSWGGDTAFLKVSEDDDMSKLAMAWTDSYDYVSSRNAVNV